MRCYSLSYKDGLNPPGNQRMWRITIASSAKGDIGLLTHEARHVLHWYAFGLLTVLLGIMLGMMVAPELYGVCAAAPWTYHVLYRIKALRIMFELACYKAQLRAGYAPGRPYTNAEFAVQAMIGHGMDEDDARKALE